MKNRYANQLKSYAFGLLLVALVSISNMVMAQVPPLPVNPPGVPTAPDPNNPPAAPAVAPAPTSKSASLVFSGIDETVMTLSWNKGNGSNRLVIAKAVSAPDSGPKTNTVYTANATFGSGQDLGGGQYVVYNGTGNSFQVKGLAASTVYHFSIFEYNVQGTAFTTYLSDSLVGSHTTLAKEPTINSSEINFSAIDLTTYTLNLTKGNGAQRLIIAKKGSATSVGPEDGVVYSADASFGAGADLGAGNYVVYKGTANTVNLTGLTAGVVYHFSVYEFNGATDATNYIRTNSATASQATKSPKPTTGTTDLLFTDVTENSYTLTWTKGNGAKRMVVAHQGAAVNALPTDGTEYIGNTNFLNGDDLGGGNYVIYNGNNNSCQIANLKPNTIYHFSIIEYNGAGVTTSYFTTAELKGNQTTFALEPTINTASMVATAIGQTTITIRIEPGNGTERIVLAKQGSAVNQFPVDGKTYTDNLVFGTSNANIGAGNYVVYKGTNTEITVTGLISGASYSFASIEYNGSTAAATNYNTNSPAVLSQQTVLSEPTTQSRTITFPSVLESSLSLKWIRGNGSNCIVLAKEATVVDNLPQDGTIYTANNVFGSGSDLGAATYVVYNGNGNACEVKGLRGNTAYHFSIFEYNGTGNTTNYFTSTVNAGFDTTLAAEPTLSASNMFFTAIGSKGMTVHFVKGKGTKRLIVARNGAQVNQVPVDGQNYVGSGKFRSGDDLGGANYVVANTAEDSVVITDLDAATSYYFAVFEYNGDKGVANYKVNDYLTGMQSTLDIRPEKQSKNMKFSNPTETSLTVSWTPGDGTGHLLVVRTGGPIINQTPKDGVEYKGDLTFGKGATLGGGVFAVYSGPGTSVTVKGLTPNTRYYFTVFEYYGDKTSNTYLVTNNPVPAAGNAATLVSKPTIPASNVLLSTALLDRSLTVSWTNGNGARRLVLVKDGTGDMRLPSDGRKYAASEVNSSYGKAPVAAGSSTFVCYDGTESSFELKDLDTLRVYYIAVLEYNESDSGYTSYGRDAFPIINNLPPAPTKAASDMQFTNITKSGMTVKWKNGDGAYRVLLAKTSQDITRYPIDGKDYSADPAFGLGDDLGFATFVLYNGVGDSVNVSRLTPNTLYNFALFEFNKDGGGPSNYVENPLLANKLYKVDTTVTGGGTTAINAIKNTGEFKLYPNPSTGAINIHFVKEQGREAIVKVYDAIGSLVYSDKLNIAAERMQALNLERLQAGVYTLLVQTDIGVITERMVVAK